MSICIYVYMYIYMYICIYVFMYLCIYIYIYMYICIYVYVYIYTYIYIYVNMYICIYVTMYDICGYIPSSLRISFMISISCFILIPTHTQIFAVHPSGYLTVHGFIIQLVRRKIVQVHGSQTVDMWKCRAYYITCSKSLSLSLCIYIYI